MQTFTAFEYICIDIANHWGKDKELFQVRIDWVLDNMPTLEAQAVARGHWKARPLYLKAVQTLRRIQRGQSDGGHMVHFDGVCSGMQIMSASTGCVSGAKASGLVDPDVRADAYAECLIRMRAYVPGLPASEHANVKKAVMTSLYGSKAKPKELFGEDTPELQAFYRAMYEMAPGACGLLQVLLDAWQPGALEHSWVLPDNHHVHVKVMTKVEKRLEVDELAHATFTYKYDINEGQDRGLSLAANVTHGLDAWVLRTLVRRCNYNPMVVEQVRDEIQAELISREMYGQATAIRASEALRTHVALWEATNIVDLVVLEQLKVEEPTALPSGYLKVLNQQLNQMLTHKPFKVVTVHDSFACHAGNMNQLRFHYKEILAQLAESTVLDHILSGIYGHPVTYPIPKHNLGTLIRDSNYALS